MTKSSVLWKKRYPIRMDIEKLVDCDLLILGACVNQHAFTGLNFDEAQSQWIHRVNQAVKKNITQARVLCPIHPMFILEALDWLIQKLPYTCKISVFSESAQALQEFANLNLDYLNEKLQSKILDPKQPESPFSFSALGERF